MGNICLVSHSSPFSNHAHVSALCHLFAKFLFTQHSGWNLTATQYAIDLRKAVGVEVPDLSGEVKRLVPVRE